MKNKITLKFNILFFLFITVTIFVNAIFGFLFGDENLLRNKAPMDRIFESSPITGAIICLTAFIVGIFFILMEAFFIKSIWNRLIVSLFPNSKLLDFQEALLIALILVFIGGIIKI